MARATFKNTCNAYPRKQKSSLPTDIAPIDFEDGASITFTDSFTYLGTILNSSLTDEEDIQNRISKANKAFGAMHFFFSNPCVPIDSKRSLYLGIAVNLVLWGSENWALTIALEQKLDRFHAKCCRRILGITMWETAMYRVHTVDILRRFGIPPLSDICHYRRLIWMGKIAQMPLTRLPRKLLAAWTFPEAGK